MIHCGQYGPIVFFQESLELQRRDTAVFPKV
jgi:hypothetical protein